MYIDPAAQTDAAATTGTGGMPNKPSPETELDRPSVYQMRIKGHLGSQWTDWFGGLTVTLEDSGESLLTGLVADQAALHGLLKRVRDLGMPLISVNRVEPSPPDAPKEPSQ